jgi:hypothetical protein
VFDIRKTSHVGVVDLTEDRSPIGFGRRYAGQQEAELGPSAQDFVLGLAQRQDASISSQPSGLASCLSFLVKPPDEAEEPLLTLVNGLDIVTLSDWIHHPRFSDKNQIFKNLLPDGPEKALLLRSVCLGHPTGSKVCCRAKATPISCRWTDFPSRATLARSHPAGPVVSDPEMVGQAHHLADYSLVTANSKVISTAHPQYSSRCSGIRNMCQPWEEGRGVCLAGEGISRAFSQMGVK